MPEINTNRIPNYGQEPNNTEFEPIETSYDNMPQHPRLHRQPQWDIALIALSAKIVGIMFLATPMLLILLGQGSKIWWAMTKHIPKPAIFLIAFGILFGNRNR